MASQFPDTCSMSAFMVLTGSPAVREGPKRACWCSLCSPVCSVCSTALIRRERLKRQPVAQQLQPVPGYRDLGAFLVSQAQHSLAGEPRVQLLHEAGVHDRGAVDADPLAGVELVLQLLNGVIHGVVPARRRGPGELVAGKKVRDPRELHEFNA